LTVIDLSKYRARIILIILCIAILLLYNLAETVLMIFYPMEYEGIIRQYAEEYDLDPLLISAIIRVESRFNPKAVSHKGAKGLMQITDGTGNWAARELDILNFSEDMLFIPNINIMIGCWYLDKLRQQFNGDLQLVLAAYNGGSGNVSKWLRDFSESNKLPVEKIPFKETREYIIKVQRALKIYKFLYGTH